MGGVFYEHPARIFLLENTLHPEEEVKPLTLQQINAMSNAHSLQLNTLSSAMHRLGEELKVKLRVAFEAGEDVTEYGIELVKKADPKFIAAVNELVSLKPDEVFDALAPGKPAKKK